MFVRSFAAISASINFENSGDLNTKKSSSNLTYLTGLFKTAFDFLFSPSNFFGCCKKFKASEIVVNPDQDPTNVNDALDQLYNQRGQFVSNSGVSIYLEAIKTNKVAFAFDRLQVSDKSLTKIYADHKHEITQETEYFVIPYNNYGHHVVILADLKKRRIEYFDPKGASCNAKESKRGPSNLASQIADLGKALGGGYTYLQNFAQYQTDHHTCGIWGDYYITERLSGKSLSSIYTTDITAFRVQMANTVRAKYSKPAPAKQIKPEQEPKKEAVVDDGFVITD